MRARSADREVSSGAKRAAVMLKRVSWLDRIWLLRKLGSEKRGAIRRASRELKDIVGPFESVLLSGVPQPSIGDGHKKETSAKGPNPQETHSLARFLACLPDEYVSAFLMGEPSNVRERVLVNFPRMRRDAIEEMQEANLTPAASEALREVILQEANRS